MNYQELVMKGEFININGMLLNSEVLLLSSYLSRKGQLWGVVEDKDGMAKFLEGEESTLTSVHIATLPLTSEALFKQVKNVEKAQDLHALQDGSIDMMVLGRYRLWKGFYFLPE